MKNPLDWEIIFYYRKTGRYAHNTLAACLQQVFDQHQIDSQFSFPKTVAHLNAQLKKSPHRRAIVFWSFYSPDVDDIQKELKQIQVPNTMESIVHIAGGVHVSAEPHASLALGFDYVAVGEGEKIIADIGRAILQADSFDSINGLHYMNQSAYVRNGRGALVNLDDYPPCSVKYKRMGPIEITRGCVYACKFCQTPFFNKARFRHRSIGNIRYHAKLMHQAGFRDYRFVSPTALSYGSQDNSVNLDAIEELLATIREIIQNRGRIFFGSFPSEVRPEHVSVKSLTILKKYVDNDNLIIGGQSGSDTMLERSHRGHSVDAIVNAVNIAIKLGFKPNVDFLYGMPGERSQDIRATLALAQHLAAAGARIHSHSFMPLPGTPFQNESPSEHDDSIEQEIHRLHSSGLAYGQWQAQKSIAKTLARNKTKPTK